MTFGDVVLKHGARKIRTLRDGTVIAGFAGAVADALTLFEKFEAQLKAWDGNLRRASVELAKEWRTDRYLRRLEAQLLVADVGSFLLLSGEGDVIEPDDGIAAIGSGAPYATAAARALVAAHRLTRDDIVQSAMRIAADLCIYHQRPLHDRAAVATYDEKVRRRSRTPRNRPRKLNESPRMAETAPAPAQVAPVQPDAGANAAKLHRSSRT